MKPSWDRLMEEFKDSKTALVADVDCTVEEDLCQQKGVEGYPTIKHGDPKALKDYDGGREYDDLLKFAQTNLGPTCGPKHMDLCDEKTKKEITDVQAMKDDDLKAKIKEKEDAIAKIEKDFETEVNALQTKYDELSKAKEAKSAEVKNSGLSTLKMVWEDRHPAPPPPPPTEDKEEEGGEDPPEGEDMPDEDKEKGEEEKDGEKKKEDL